MQIVKKRERTSLYKEKKKKQTFRQIQSLSHAGHYTETVTFTFTHTHTYTHTPPSIDPKLEQVNI